MVDILCPREVSKFTYVTCLEMVVWLCGGEKKGGGVVIQIYLYNRYENENV
jgi:hypothetical protein